MLSIAAFRGTPCSEGVEARGLPSAGSGLIAGKQLAMRRFVLGLAHAVVPVARLRYCQGTQRGYGGHTPELADTGPVTMVYPP